MSDLDLVDVCTFVNENIVNFHKKRIYSLESLKLDLLLRKNPYLFRAKNITTAHELITGLLDAFLSSSEEKLFGDFLEELAIFITEKTFQGHKSSAQGVDIEFFKNDIHYIVSVKSGTNWGNSSQHKKLKEDLAAAVTRIKQSHYSRNVQSVLGICYGKTKTGILISIKYSTRADSCAVLEIHTQPRPDQITDKKAESCHTQAEPSHLKEVLSKRKVLCH